MTFTEYHYMALYIALADSTQLGQIFLYNTLETNVAHSDYPALIAHIKVCTSRHQSLRQTQAFMKSESHMKMSGHLIDMTHITTAHSSLVN